MIFFLKKHIFEIHIVLPNRYTTCWFKKSFCFFENHFQNQGITIQKIFSFHNQTCLIFFRSFKLAKRYSLLPASFSWRYSKCWELFSLMTTLIFLLETTLQLGFSEVWMCFQSLESLKNKITNIKKYPLVSGRFLDMWKSIKCGTSAIQFCATSCLSYSHIAHRS